MPAVDIRRRYYKGVQNLFQLYRPILDTWLLYDASFLPPRLISFEESGNVTITDTTVFQQIRTQGETSHAHD